MGLPINASAIAILVYNYECQYWQLVRIIGSPYTFNESITNPRRMCEGYGSRSVTVCVHVCYCASCYIPVLCVENKVPLGFSW